MAEPHHDDDIEAGWDIARSFRLGSSYIAGCSTGSRSRCWNAPMTCSCIASLQTIGPVPVVERVEVLPVHQMGASKWHELGREYPLEGCPPPDKALIERVREQFRSRGLTTF